MGAQQDTYNSCLVSSRIDRMHLTALIVSYSTLAEGVTGSRPRVHSPPTPVIAAYARRTPRRRLVTRQRADYC